MQDLISVVIPAYNSAQWLNRCIDSILAQTYENLEVIVVNDGSTDETESLVAAYQDPRVKYVYQKNGGIISARLTGVSAASGQWVTFVDADDMIEPDMYSLLLGNAHKYQAEISHCGFQEIHEDGRTLMVHGTGMIRVQDNLTGVRDLLEDTIIAQGIWDKLFRRELFAGLRGVVDESICNGEDLLLNSYLFGRARKSVFQDTCCYRYLVRDGSVSRRKPNERILFEPIKTRQIVMENCRPELKDDARRSLVRICLVSYRLLAMEKKEEYREQERRLRAIIREQKQYCSILSFKNAAQVHLVCYAPWLYRLLYRLCARWLGI